MLDRLFSIGLDLFALASPISLAATNIIFFPMAIVWLLAARRTFQKWPPVWGWPEKFFLFYLAVSLVSALAGIDPRHSLREIKNKDFYILIAIVLVALVRDREKHQRLIKLFMLAGAFTAIFGLVQWAVGVNQDDKSNGIFLYLPAALASWPRPLLNLLSMLDGRVMGTRGHPLAYAECLLFNWAFAICFMLSGKAREWIKWLIVTLLCGAALVSSQSRGPWIAAGIILILALLCSRTRRSWMLLAIGILFVAVFGTVPALRARAASIVDRSHRSNQERLHMWHAGWELWKTHPILGIGPGNVKQVSYEFQTPRERLWGSWGHLHSTYINFLAERGALGLVAFIFLVGAFCWELWQALRKAAGDPYAAAIYQATLLSVVGFLIGGLTETSYNTAVVNMTLYFVLGLALGLSRHVSTARV